MINLLIIRNKTFFLSIFITIVSYVNLISQSDDIKFKRLTINNGLSQSIVLSLIQDKKGFIWIGTANGLNKYDGYSFKIYKRDPQNQYSISNNIINDLCLTEDGKIWIATQRGLNLYNPETEKFISFLPDKNNKNSISDEDIRSIYLDKNNFLWIGTAKGGLNKLILSKSKLSDEIEIKKNVSIEIYQNEEHNDNSVTDNRINAITGDNAGNIWIATPSGLNKFDQNTNIFTRFTTENSRISFNYISKVLVDKSNNIWAIANGTIDIYNPSDNQFRKLKSIPEKETNIIKDISSIFQDSDEYFWIGVFNLGIIKIKVDNQYNILKSKEYKKNIYKPHELSSNNINEFFEDGKGTIWIGTLDGGINYFEKEAKRFIHFKYSNEPGQGLSDNVIGAIYEDQNRTIWVGTWNNGLNAVIKNKNGFNNYHLKQNEISSTLSREGILSIIQFTDDKLLLGTWKGLYEVEINPGKFTRNLVYKSINIAGFENDMPIWSLLKDSDGNIWAGSAEGLFNFKVINKDKLELNARIIYNPKDKYSILNNSIWNLYEDRSKTIWIGTTEGLNRLEYNDRKAHKFLGYSYNDKDRQGLSSNAIKSILEDRSGNIWVGTEGGGLNKFNKVKGYFENYSEAEGMPDDVIWGILEDDKGYLWLSTNNGLVKFNTDTKEIRKFDESDGLQGNEFKMGAYHQGNSGNLYFGGTNGVTFFHPDSINEKKESANVVITDFKVFNQSLKIGNGSEKRTITKSIQYVDEVTLSYKDYIFSIEFSALEFKNPNKIRYAYKLEGFDESWNYTNADNRNAVYTNLSGGKYTFLVKSTNYDGTWNEKSTQLIINVSPPFWQTVYFFIFLIIIFAIGIFLYTRFTEFKILKDKKALIQEKDLLQNLMDNIPDTIYFKDKFCQFIRINKSQATLLGLKNPEDAIGKSDFDFFEQEHANQAFVDEQRIMKTGDPIIDKVEHIKHALGYKIWVTTTKIATRDKEGNITGIVGITRNINERIEAEELLRKAKIQAEEADQIKSAFLANMSHEIRTPMNSIIGFTDLLLEENISDKDRIMYLNYIRNSGHSLLNLINDIIDIAKIEAGQLKIKKSDCRVNNLLSELVVFANELSRRYNKDQIRIIYKKENLIQKLTISTDPFRLRQILSNIIGNAVKFTEKGQIEFGYHIIDNKIIEYFVKDTGVGIPPDKLELIFDRFGQVESGSTKNSEGAGLGLAITKKLVEILGGTIKVESQVGVGSEFKFSFPFEQMDEKKENPDWIKSPKNEIPDWSNKTILIAEDDGVNYKLLEIYFTKTQARLVKAVNGQEAVNYMKGPDAENVNIVLMDIQMPVMDGYEATKIIKSIKKNLTIIAHSAYSMAGDRERIIQSGCDDYIPKPYTEFEIFAIVSKYMPPNNV